MSILIKGYIGLPRDCCKCPFNCYGLCLANHSKLSVDKCVKSRHSDCPLVEVPTPHGDLVDRDDLIDEINRVTFVKRYDYNVAYNIVTDAETIIEAEASEL